MVGFVFTDKKRPDLIKRWKLLLNFPDMDQEESWAGASFSAGWLSS